MTCHCSENQDHPTRGEFVAEVLSQEPLGGQHCRLWLIARAEAAEVMAAARPGQFVQVACRDLDSPRIAAPLLRRPFSLAGVYRAEQLAALAPGEVAIELIYQRLGPGTGFLAHCRPGETLNLLGPLGNGFRIDPASERPALLVGGGVGLPPLFFLARCLAEQSQRPVTAFAGARTADDFVGQVILQPGGPGGGTVPVLLEFDRVYVPSRVATDDGSTGRPGTVVAALEAFMEAHPDVADAELFACGPDGMLAAVARLAQARGLACQVCLEAYMACGIGVCQSCVVPVHSRREDPNAPGDAERQYRLVCSHGPVFNAEDILWE